METVHNHRLIVTIVNKGWSEKIVEASGQPVRKAVPLFTAGGPAFTNGKCSLASPLNRKRSLS